MFKLNENETALAVDCGAKVGFAITQEQLDKMAENPAVVRHVITIGLKNILQDSHARAVRDDFKTDDEWIEAKRKFAGDKLQSMITGELRVKSGGTRASAADPLARYRNRAALLIIRAKAPDKIKGLKGDDLAAFVTAFIAKNAELVEKRAIVLHDADAAAAIDADVEL